MQKLKKNGLSFIITSFSLVLAIVLSFSMAFIKPKKVYSAPANGVGFISATTSIRQSEPELINGDYVSSFTLADDSAYYFKPNAVGNYVKVTRTAGANEVIDYIQINKDNYCDENGEYTSTGANASATPTNWINLLKNYPNSKNVLVVSNCEIVQIGTDKFIYNGVDFFNFNSPVYCVNNDPNNISDTPTDYAVIEATFSGDSNIFNICDKEDERFDLIKVEGYNYKSFENYQLASSILDGKNYYFKTPTSNEPVLLNVELLINASYYTLLDSSKTELPFKNDAEGNPTAELDNGKTLSDATYIKINENLFVPIENNLYTKIDDFTENYYYKTYVGEPSNQIQIQNPTDNPIYSLKHDNNSSNFLNSYHYVGEEGNEQRIPLNAIKYENATGNEISLFNNIYYDNIGGIRPDDTETPNIALNNYIARNSLITGASVQENIENYYIAFGDIAHTKNKNSNIIVDSLSVSATLKNKYYPMGKTLLLNDVVAQTASNENDSSNHYWYQYFDLEEVYEAVSGDISTPKKILYPEGLYTFTFEYSTRSEAGSSGTQYFTHSVYLYNTSSYSTYPSLNTEILMEGEIQNEQPLSYYYNYQTNEYPTYSFDPSKFSVEYSKYYNGETTNFFTTFETKSRSTNSASNNDAIAKETSYLYINQGNKSSSEVIKTIKIDAELYKDETSGLLTYVYVYRNVNSAGSYSFSHKETVLIKQLAKSHYAQVKYLTYDPNHEYDIVSMGSKISNKLITFLSGYEASEETYSSINTVYNAPLCHELFNLNSSNIATYINRLFSTDFEVLHSYSGFITKFNNGKFDAENSNLDQNSATYVNNNSDPINSNFASAINLNYLFNIENEKQIFDYNYDIVFNELGEYSIKNNYSIASNLNDIYTTLENDALNFNPEFKNRDFGANQVKENEYNLTLFGVRAYFNKDGSTELLNEGINANVSEALNEINLNAITSGITHEDIYNKLFSGNTTKVAIPNTNMPPITFEHLCEYAYNLNNPYSKMYKFSMNQFTYDNLTQKVTLKGTQTPATYHFTKNTYPSTDGFYIIIIDYSIDEGTFSNQIGTTYIDSSNEFNRGIQVFAFVIDNSSPEIKIEKLVSKIESNTELSKSWKPLEKGSYTNSNVRITYSVPTFFQYNKSIQLKKTNYAGITSNYGSNASTNWVDFEYENGTSYETTIKLIDSSNNEITVNLVENENNVYSTKYSNNLNKVPMFKLLKTDGTEFKLEGKTTFIPSDLENISKANKKLIFSECYDEDKTRINVEVINYYFEFIVYSTSNGSYWGSGNYDVKLNYGSNQNSNITYRFTIDTLPISNMEISAVNIENEVTLNRNIELGGNLINNAFTFLYNAKNSGAPIKTTYKKYTFSFSELYGSNLISGDGVTGISADNFLNISSSNDNLVYEYLYDYSYYQGGDRVYFANVFNPSITTLYVFELIDSAGNKANYFVIFDNSIPKYTVTADEDSISNTDGITIITDTTEIFWGNYKAIELEYFNNKAITDYNDYTTSQTILNKYLYNGETNHNAKSIDKAFKELINNSNSYKNSTIKQFYKAIKADGKTELIEINRDITLSYEGNKVYYNGIEVESQIVGSYHVPTTYYYLLVPIQTANFNFRNTNADDSNTYTKNYSPSINTSVLLDVTPNSLAKNYASKFGGDETTLKNIIKNPSYTNPSSSDFYKYGFYGEKYYNFTISDILNNQDKYALWMNFDLTQAWAYGTFSLERTELSSLNHHNIQLLPNESTYATGQLYFSYLPGNGSTIPNSDVEYKFYEFDINFYSNHTLTKIEVVDDNENVIPNAGVTLDNTQNYKLTFTHKDGVTTFEKLISRNKFADAYKDIAEGSDDYGKVIRTEPNSFYPFNVLDSDWTTLFSSTDEQLNKKNTSTYSKGDSRVYSTLIEETSDNNSLNSKPGLYIFKRTYVDYIDKSTGNIITDYDKENGIFSLGNDTPIRYYVYYVDRNSIIDISNSIGLDIIYKLGIGNFEEGYTTTVNYNAIESKYATDNKNLVSTATNSAKSVDNLFSTNRNLVESEYVIDKYSAIKNYKKLYSNAEYGLENANLITQKYVFNLHTNQFFLNFDLRNNVKTNPNVFIGNSNGNANYINPNQNLKQTNFALTNLDTNQIASSLNSSTRTFNATQYAYEELASRMLNLELTRILLRKAYTYKFTIEDNAGYDNNDTNSYNQNCNSYVITYSIKDQQTPNGNYFGKHESTNYASNSDMLENYASSLLNEFDSLKNIATTDSLNTSGEVNVRTFGYSNNKSLIFAYELTDINTNAEINPFVVTISKQSAGSSGKTQLLQITAIKDGKTFKPEFSPASINGKNTSLSLIYDKNNPSRFLVVVFDNSTSCNEYNDLLSKADENATYSITIQFKGHESYYQTSIDNDKSYFQTTNELVIDHVKPLRNIIKLMESDVYYSHNSLSFPYGYNPNKGMDIDAFIASNSNLYGLTLQSQMEAIYNEYLKVYGIRTANNTLQLNNNYFFALDKSNSDLIDKLLNNKAYPTYSNIGDLDHRRDYGTFVRLIPDPTEYKYSLTPDDYLSNADMPDHGIFQESSAITLNNAGGGTLDPSNFYVLTKDFVNTYIEPDYYYEIIERDEAGNYRVYAIFCTYSSVYNLNYTASNSTNTNTTIGGYISTVNNDIIVSNNQTIYGTNLIINFKNNSYKNGINIVNTETIPDTYQRIEFSYSFANKIGNNETVYSNANNPITIKTDPITNNISIEMNGSSIINKIDEINTNINGSNITLSVNNLSNSLNQFAFKSIDKVDKANELLAYLTGICKQIVVENEDKALDFNFNIKIFDRIAGVYNLNYYYPGRLIELEFQELPTELEVKIPEDNPSTITRIIRFDVKKFNNNGWDSSVMDYGDNHNNTFIQYNNGKSLGGNTYYLGNGVYKFTLVDNFGRNYEVIKTYQQNTVTNDVSFTGPVIEKVSNGKTTKYTAKPVVVTYDLSFYEIKLYYKLANSSIYSELTDISTQQIANSFNLIVEQISETGKKLTISPLDNKHTSIKIELINQADKSSIETHMFDLYTIIPEFQVENLSGKTIGITDGQFFIENFNIVLNTSYSSHIDFSTYIDIVFTNIDNETIHLKTNNIYEVNQAGTYVVKTANALGYSSKAFTLNRDSKTTISYSVYAVSANGDAIKLKHSAIHTSTYTPEGSNAQIVYHYYALSKYSAGYSINASKEVVESYETDHILIITNSNNSVNYKIVSLSENKSSALVRIFTTSSEDQTKTSTMHYLQINFVEESNSFAELSITDSNNEVITNNKFIVEDSININLSKYFNDNNNKDANNPYVGNLIELSYTYNGQYANTISGNDSINVTHNGVNYYKFLTLTESGVYRFTISDLAGNILQFSNGNNYLEVVLLNNIIYTINENDPEEPEVAINNYITNKPVNLRLITQLNGIDLYTITSISAYRNGQEITFEQQNENSFIFSEAGNYLITVVATLTNDEIISSNIQFMIINSNVSMLSLNVSSAKSFEVVEILKKSVTAENSRFTKLEINNANELWLSSNNNQTGNGYYIVTLRWFHKGMQQYYNFSFDVRINNEIPSLYANIEFGTSSKQPIVIYYNPGKIYNQVGESKIMINDTVIAIMDSSSENTQQSYTITTSNEYWIKVVDPDGRTLTSYKVTKTTPLNTTAKIVIAVSVIVAVGLTVLFILIRRKVRFK